MDSLSVHSFSANVPFRQPVVITHYISMVIAFLGCYPVLLTQKIRKQKIYIIALFLFFALISLITGFIINIPKNTTSFILHTFAFILIFLVIIQLTLFVYRSAHLSDRIPFIHSIKHIPKWVDLVIGWTVLVLSLCYLTMAALVFTESCNDYAMAQCLMPLAMGTGFLLYGTLILLHLLSILKLPRPSTPEYYEGVIITLWGFISLILARTSILGSEWRALNLGLLWFTGGLFSISITLQTWITPIRERNIINSLIICLTGRAIITGITQKDSEYASDIHTMLGYLLIVGSIARLFQIMFRKTPTEDLPHLLFQKDIIVGDEDEDEECDIHVNEYTHKQKDCKHTTLFASITLISGLLVSTLSICAGILFMGANIGWLRYMEYYIQDPSTYVNITLAVAFLWSSYVFGLCTLYRTLQENSAKHNYEYLELNSVNIDLPTTSDRTHWTSSVSTPHSNYINISQPNTYNNITLSSSPVEYTSPTLLPTEIPGHPVTPRPEDNHPTLTKLPEMEKTIRPSEYRAKRRSLLIQSPILLGSYQQYHNIPDHPIRASTLYGVGGILPDETINPKSTSVDTLFRKSWISSESSVGYYSGSVESLVSDSPPERPYSSLSSTLPVNYNSSHTQSTRRNSMDGELGIYLQSEDEKRERRGSVKRTESGRRKTRLAHHRSTREGHGTCHSNRDSDSDMNDAVSSNNSP